MKILIIEDDQNIGNNIKEYLEENSYIIDWETNGATGFNFAKNRKYDIIIVDIMLPGKDGFQIINDLRKLGINTPIIILTAKDSLENKTIGFQAGADDYLIKPFSLKELKLRIQAIIRRIYNINGQTDLVNIAEYSLDLNKKTLFKNHQEIILTKKEYQILEILMLNKNKVVSKKEIQEQIWGINNDIWSDVIKSHIQIIRSKINDPDLIQTVRGIGFIINENYEKKH